MRARPGSATAPVVGPWHFPAVIDPVTAGPPTVDPTRFIAALGDRLGSTTAMRVAVTCDHDTSTVPPSSRFVRSDGMQIALTVPAELVGAIVGARCGGRFVPAAAAGAGGSMVDAEIVAAIHDAADAAWPGGSGWLPADGDTNAPTLALTLSVEGFTFSLPCAVVPPPTTAAKTPDTSGWGRRLRAVLDATPFEVRVVLHDRVVPLRDALAIHVGDVLPIETRRDVSLRLGDRAFARGTITPDDDGGHRITIIAVGDPGITPATKEEA